MTKTRLKARQLPAFLIAATLAAGPVLADPPEGKGKGKGKGKGRVEHVEYLHESARDDRRSQQRVTLAPSAGVYFADRHRVVIRDYHGEDYRRGFCPPGLAKKNNGCMPPGQAKKWHIGRPLAHDVIYYDLPPQLVVQIGVPPPGYRYVRVAADILLIAVGTGMVIDAITDLGRM
jgi:hypothetical protein